MRWPLFDEEAEEESGKGGGGGSQVIATEESCGTPAEQPDESNSNSDDDVDPIKAMLARKKCKIREDPIKNTKGVNKRRPKRQKASNHTKSKRKSLKTEPSNRQFQRFPPKCRLKA